VNRALAQAVAVASSVAAGACSLIDAATGDSECSLTEETQDLGVGPLNAAMGNSCDRTFVLPGDGNNVAIFKFHNPSPHTYEICVDHATGGTGTLSTDRCGFEQVLDVSLTGACPPQSLSQQDYFLLVPATETSCGSVVISTRELGDGGGGGPIEQCMIGVDDDADTRTDCEQPSCRAGAGCNHPSSGETCDDADDGPTAGFPAGSVDELACRCVNDSGCDQIQTGTPQPPYICHSALPSGGACAPSCTVVNWCANHGLTCQGDGRCG
jgi:hypothetical protein